MPGGRRRTVSSLAADCSVCQGNGPLLDCQVPSRARSRSNCPIFAGLMKQIVSCERCTDLSLEEFGVQKPEGMKKTMTAPSVGELQRETARKIPRQPFGSGKERRVNGKLRQFARRITRPLVAALLAGTLPGGPFSLVFAQETQNPPPKAPPQPAVQAKPPIPVSLGLSKYNYSRAPRPFPNLIAPYRSTQIPGVDVVNAPRIEQLIHDGKLELGL